MMVSMMLVGEIEGNHAILWHKRTTYLAKAAPSQNQISGEVEAPNLYHHWAQQEH